MPASVNNFNTPQRANNDAVGAWLQVGFIEGIANESRSFHSLKRALRQAFKRNRESAILLWNAIPVPLDYAQDVPAIISPLVDLLYALQNNSVLSNYEVSFAGKNIATTWVIDADSNHIALCAEWHRVRGNYQEALNSFSTTTVDRESFINEWKLLLGQCKQAILDSGANLWSGKAKAAFSKLCEVEESIQARGRYYLNNK